MRVELIGPRRRVVARATVSAPVTAGLEGSGADLRRGFTFVHTVALPGRRAAGLLARDGRLTVRVSATAALDVDRDGRSELGSTDDGHRAGPRRQRRTAAVRDAAAGLRQARRSGDAAAAALQRAGPLDGRRRSETRLDTPHRLTFTYRARPRARGWDGLVLTARPATGGRASAADAAAPPARAAAAPIAVPAVALIGSGAPSTTRVRAIGDSITAGFGWYFNGASMSIERLLGCRPGSPLNDACSSNSLTTSNTAPLQYAPDYGLSNRIAWPAQWAARYGITDFANYAVTGSAPSDWLPGGAFYPQLRTAEAAAPDYLVFTLGANPLLSDVLFGIGNMECAIWSDLFGNFTDCIMRAFARVNLQANLRALYAHLLAYTPAKTRIVAMQYYTAIPSIALAYSSAQLERMAELLDQVIVQTVAATGSSRITTLSPPRFNVGIDMQPLYPSRYSCGGSFVDGPSNQSSATQWSSTSTRCRPSAPARRGSSAATPGSIPTSPATPRSPAPSPSPELAGQLWRERSRPLGVHVGEPLGRHLERVRRLGRSADDEPERVCVGVVEDLAQRARLDEQRGERSERETLLALLAADPDPARALEHDVQLLLLAVAVPGRRLARSEVPQARPESGRAELLGEIGVEDAELVRRTPEGVAGRKDGVAHHPTLCAARPTWTDDFGQMAQSTT